MKHACDLTREQLLGVVDQVQQLLYLDLRGESLFWNPDKDWDSETIEYVACVFEDTGLKPPQRAPLADTPVIASGPADETRAEAWLERKVAERQDDGAAKSSASGLSREPASARKKARASVAAGPLVLDRLTALGPEEACLKAVTEILDVPHHAYLIAVHEVAGADGASVQIAIRDPYDRLGDVQRFGEGRLATVRVPGYVGDYVLVIVPFEV